MKTIRRFLLAWGVWTLLILLLAFLASSIGGAGASNDPWRYTNWVAGAMTLAGFPAGIIAARDVVNWERAWLAPLLAFAGTTIAIAVLVFAVRGFVGPGLIADQPGEPATWSLGDRVAALADAEAAAEAAGTLDAWITANRIGFEVDVTVTTALTAIAFAWIGALLGAWLPTGLRRDLRIAIVVTAGMFLLMTGYLMTENGYELLLLKTLGPAYVIAWFPLISPGMTAVGLMVPTLARLLGNGGWRDSGHTEAAGR